MRRVILILLMLATLALAACGGGGGGDSGASISISTNPISMQWEEGKSAPPGRINFTATGTTSDGVYIGYTNPQNHISDITAYATSDTTAYFSVTPNSSLTEGTYTGTLTINVCRDSYCKNHYAGSPATISYTLKVTPTLKVSPSSLSFKTASGQTTSTNIIVQLPPGSASYTASIDDSGYYYSNGKDYINVAQSGNTVTVSTLTGRSGTYNTAVLIKNDTRTIKVPVELVITPPASGVENNAIVNTTQISLSAKAGGTSDSQTILVTPPTWSNTYKVYKGSPSSPAKDFSWLKVTETIANTYAISADANNLSKGSYSAYVCFGTSQYTTYYGSNSCTTVNLTIGDGLIAPTTQTVIINSESSAGTAQGQFKIDVTPGVVVQSWTATSDAAWLTFTKATGKPGEQLSYTVDGAALANNSEQSGTITVKTDRSNIGTTIAIKSKKVLADVLTVNPTTIAANKATRILVTGSGFKGGEISKDTYAGLSNLSALLQTTGFTPTKIEAIDDKQLAIDVPALAAGSYSISISNGLGIQTGKKSFSATTISVPAGEINSTGSKRAVFFDPARNAIFEVNKTNSTLQRHTHNGQSWQSSSVTITGLVDAALSQDGQYIFALQSAGKVLKLDPQTLSTVNEYTNNMFNKYIGAPRYGRGIGITSDGKVWFGASTEESSSSYYGVLTYFDPIRNGFDYYKSSKTGSNLYENNLNIAQSAYGTKLFIATEYYDIYEFDNIAQNHTKKSIGSQTLDMATNADGTRIVLNANVVYDSQWGTVGKLSIDSTRKVLTAIPSPDGRRVYLLHVPSSSYGSSTQGQLQLSVFDSSASLGATANLPVLSTTDIATVTSSCYYNSDCLGSYKATLTPDGNTLLVSGGDKLRIIKLASNQQASIMASRNKKAPQSGIRFIPVPNRLFKK